jgi:hypothetical protein
MNDRSKARPVSINGLPKAIVYNGVTYMDPVTIERQDWYNLQDTSEYLKEDVSRLRNERDELLRLSGRGQSHVNDQQDAKVLKRENEQLKMERDAAIRAEQKLKAQMDRLQGERMQIKDRFQPDVDEAITKELGGVEKDLATMVPKYVAQKSTLSDGQWQAAARTLMWGRSLNPKADGLQFYRPDSPQRKEFQKKILRSAVWKFLRNQLLTQPFDCFPSDEVEKIESAFHLLYPTPGTKTLIRTKLC